MCVCVGGGHVAWAADLCASIGTLAAKCMFSSCLCGELLSPIGCGHVGDRFVSSSRLLRVWGFGECNSQWLTAHSGPSSS